MKFTLLAVALLVSSAPFVGAHGDAEYGRLLPFNDPDYSYEGNGYCMASSRLGVPLGGATAN